MKGLLFFPGAAIITCTKRPDEIHDSASQVSNIITGYSLVLLVDPGFCLNLVEGFTFTARHLQEFSFLYCTHKFRTLSWARFCLGARARAPIHGGPVL
ncbi:hypothetical protein V6N13_112300 [Hibiscus sabdariffa]